MAGLLLVLWFLGGAFAQGVSGFVSPGPLAEPHAHLEGITQCFECHSVGQGVTAGRCLTCHTDIKSEVDAGSGFHSNKGVNCQSCHPDHRGRNFKMVRMKEAGFDHDATGFPLNGAHEVPCVDCHETEGKWKGLEPACASCHEDPHGVHPSRRKVRSACETCHTDINWDALPLAPFLFDHNDTAQCDYRLEGAHGRVACAECHDDWVFFPIAHQSCQDCHSDPHRTDFEAPCEDCHAAPVNFEVADFDHDRTPFRLLGKHRSVGCEDCHENGVSEALPFSRCGSCHPDRHRGEFKPKDCNACHSVSGGFTSIARFDHDDTPFPLTDEHAVTPCDSCHKGGSRAVFRGLPSSDCDACHKDAHDARFEPVDCSRCHSPVDFRVPIFDHGSTAFPHTGKHVGLQCEKCHTGGTWTDLQHDSCANCHGDANPHELMPSESCAECHQTTGFSEIVFDHETGTGFALGLMHSEAQCSECHAAVSSFVGNEPACMTCHETPTKAHYEGECGSCHTEAHWAPGGLGDADHAVTGFALRGAHARQSCTSCHAEGHPRGEAVASCAACHGADDTHRHLLGNTCEDCHTARSWLVSRFRHYSTGWPLQGSHRLAPCTSCHAAGYIGTPTQCFRCHEAEASPDTVAHQSVYFPLCDTCHRPYGWELQRFPH